MISGQGGGTVKIIVNPTQVHEQMTLPEIPLAIYEMFSLQAVGELTIGRSAPQTNVGPIHTQGDV